MTLTVPCARIVLGVALTTLPLLLSCGPTTGTSSPASREASPVLSSPQASSAQPTSMDGFYLQCGNLREFKPCDGSPPYAVSTTFDTDAAYARLGLPACENAFARFPVDRNYPVRPKSLRSLPHWYSVNGAPRWLLLGDPERLEPIAGHQDCKAYTSALDRLRPVVEASKAALVLHRQTATFGQHHETTCQAVAGPWGIRDLRDIYQDYVVIRILIIGDCLPPEPRRRYTTDVEDAAYFNEVGGEWRLHSQP